MDSRAPAARDSLARASISYCGARARARDTQSARENFRATRRYCNETASFIPSARERDSIASATGRTRCFC